MTSLLLGNFLLEQGDPIRAQVQALNSIGFSEVSDLSGNSLVQVPPAQPTLLIARGEQTTETQLQILFEPQAEDGGAAIDFYEVEISDDNGLTFVLAGSPTASPAVLTHAKITSG